MMMINIPKKDKLKKEQWEDDAQVTESSQIQQQHDVVEKQFDHVKALLQANQLLTEGLRTKLLQIWCNVRKNQAGESLDDEMSEDGTESLDVFSGEESSVASGRVGALLNKQQSSVVKLPMDNGQTEGANGHTEISHLEHNVNCFTDHIPITQLQVGTRCLEGEVADLEKDFEQHCVVPKEQIASPKYASSKTETVDRTSHTEQLVTHLESTTNKMREYNQKIMPAKGTIEDTAETVKGRLQKVQWQLSEIEEANRSLHFQIIKLNTDYSQIQEFHQSMTGDNKTSANQRVDLQANFNNTAEENEQMLQVITKLETRIEATLLNLTEIKMEKNCLERQFRSLKDVYNSQRGGRIAEKEQFKDCGKALSEGQVLRARPDREHVRTQNLKQDIAAVRSENHRLQRVTEEEIKKSKLVMADAKRWKKECHKLTAEHQEKVRSHYHSVVCG
ncbi:uncharacterized protein LOC116971776 [Amblyraja radiata]|uniref:uncharacterized protein LOC116971776 n=1 Tax=Amblyraja radiata TaxID=386614 RepID=UPI00140250FF|nr:uncharacterized protein LOC116971776 [Amblyraja radiata]